MAEVRKFRVLQTPRARISHEVSEYVKAHLEEKLTLDGIAQALHYSRSYITREFRNGTGESIQEYIAGQRISKAGRMLLQGIPASEVAVRLGYSSTQYFYKCFKDAVGMPPVQFVKVCSENGPIPLKIGKLK